MITSVKQAIKLAARSVGVDIIRTNPTSTVAHRRQTMMTHHGIEVALDVGANTGGYASELREAGYRGEILSFEPLSEAYKQLEKNASSDPKWRVFHNALGAYNGVSEINIAGNSWSSSLLPMLDTHLRNEPRSQYQSTEQVTVRTLDSALDGIVLNTSRVLLKIDTQGYEHHVLEGAKSLLRQVLLIECELSMEPLYEGQYLFQEMVNLLNEAGFRPVHFNPVFSDLRTGYCLQVDGIFTRSV
jgi:FkbM family methyltransferase